MDFIVNEPNRLCESFFENFDDLWNRANQHDGFRAYVLGLLSEAHRKNVAVLSGKVVGQDYQSLHHFLTDSPWDDEELNRRRIAALQADRRTASRRDGVLILDDTGVPKKGHSTEGVKRQYIGQVGKTANGQVFVTSHYADTRRHWPVDILPYVPDTWLPKGKEDPAFRTKLILALSLIKKARDHGIAFRAVVVDSWYGSNPDFIQSLEQDTVPYVAELRRSMRVFVRLPGDVARNEHTLEQALCLLKRKDFRPVRIPYADGTEREAWIARLDVKLKKLPLKRRVVVVTTKPENPAQDEDLRFLTTNVEEFRDDTVAKTYALRNWVEEFYREAKDDLGGGQYQVRDLASILRHWKLVFVAHSLLQRLRMKGILARLCEKPIRTLRQTLMALRDYLRQVYLLQWLPDHIEVFKEHLQTSGYLFPDAELTK